MSFALSPSQAIGVVRRQGAGRAARQVSVYPACCLWREIGVLSPWSNVSY